MRKNIYKFLAFSLLALGFASCEKEEIGGTAVQEMAGEWYVVADAVDENGNLVEEDIFGMGYFPIFTYNTNANLNTEMYIDDDGNFWDFKVIANVNYSQKTFSVSDAIMYYEEDEETEEVYPVHCTITNGKIVKDGTKSPAGYTSDSISFEVSFEDDPYPAAYGYDHYLFHGYRRTGLNGGYD